MAKGKEKKLLFSIDGFNVYSDSTYLVSDKKDGDAPTGFVEAGLSKLPHDGVDEVFEIPSREIAPGVYKWDTGFYEYSPCYGDMPIEEQKIVIKNLQKNVVEPYRRFLGDNEIFNNSKTENYSGLLFRVWTGKIFRTESPADRLELYFAILAKQITPPGLEGDSRYRPSFYTLYDTTKKAKQRDENNLSFFKAAGVFSTLYTQDKHILSAILTWIGMPKYSKSIDEGTLTSIFHDYVHSNPDRVSSFLNTVSDVDNDLFKEKIIIYQNLKDKLIKTGKLQRSTNGLYFYDNVEVGADIKSAAENISKNPAFRTIKEEVIAT